MGVESASRAKFLRGVGDAEDGSFLPAPLLVVLNRLGLIGLSERITMSPGRALFAEVRFAVYARNMRRQNVAPAQPISMEAYNFQDLRIHVQAITRNICRENKLLFMTFILAFFWHLARLSTLLEH